MLTTIFDICLFFPNNAARIYNWSAQDILLEAILLITSKTTVQNELPF